MTFASKLKSARKSAGLTQAQAAKLLDTGARNYWDYESGRVVPCRAFQVGAIALLKEKP